MVGVAVGVPAGVVVVVVTAVVIVVIDVVVLVVRDVVVGADTAGPAGLVSAAALLARYAVGVLVLC